MHPIVFMGTPDFAVPILQALIATQQVVGVVTQPDRPAGRGKRLQASPVKVAALAANLPVYQPRSLRKPDSADPIRRWQPQAIVVAAFGQILRPHLLSLPAAGCINVHASLLPRWRGAAPIQHAILAGDSRSGVCLMHMEEGVDTGPVYSCLETPLRPDETAASLHDRLAQLGARLIVEALPAVLAGERRAQPQDDSLATYAPMISKDDGRIDWHNSAGQIERQVRAMTPWPGAFTTWHEQTLKIAAARIASAPGGPPGTVRQADEGAVVQTGDGGLRLLKVQLAGRRQLDIADFVRGQPALIDSQLQ